ncbi:RES family NAD+ phosphorylase [Falsiruegeria mediterranea]|jgi:RES domain-containing protein
MTDTARHIARIEGRFWRAGFLGQEHDLLSPARAPQGRWHHSGQKALYLSQTPEGCQVALRVYVQPQDPPRAIFPFAVENATVADLRSHQARELWSVSLDDIHAFWAELHAKGEVSPTWHLGDRLRAQGLDGLLTPSRSRPDLTHLSLFRWNAADGPKIRRDGPSQAFDPHY